MPELDRARLEQGLLRAGLAPRHVRRTLAELEDHYEDLVEQALDAGHDRMSACNAAITRIGATDDIVAAARARPELMSWGHRFPRTAALVYPLTCVAILPAAPLFIGFAHAASVVRWMLCLLLSGIVTAGLFLALQLAITHS